MKKLFLLLFIALPLMILAQETVSGVSPSGYVNITKDPPKPPYLEISGLQFMDTDGNRKINATEQTFIYFNLSNSGLGPGLNLKLSVKEKNRLASLQFDEIKNIGKLEVGKSRQIQIPISSTMDLQTAKASFAIKVEEANGFDTETVQIEIETKAFRSPVVSIVDYKVTSQNSSTLQKRKPFDVQVLVQNVGEGSADGVAIQLPLPDGVFCLTGNENHMIGVLGSGEQHMINYTLVTNTEYTASTIPLNFTVTEKLNRYGYSKEITLTMNQGVSSEKMIVKGKPEKNTAIDIASLSSKVDKNIPYSPLKNPKRIALIIGNENYAGNLNAEINVDFARNDAQVFKQYAINTMGVEEKNMHFLLDATAGQMRREIDLVAAILAKLDGQGELIFYYAGHGLPDENTKVPYLIPVDVNATHLGSAINLTELYQKLYNSNSARVTVFLDACFSGGGRNQGLLAARGVKVRPKKGLLMGNIVVFSATSGEQSALPFYDEKHGMFTYFLLEKIQQSNGTLNYGDLSNYLIEKVGIESLRENGKSQDPEVNTSHSIAGIWKAWTLN